MDTFRFANEVMEGYGTAGDLPAKLRCPFHRLHNGGNDAHFTLKTSLFWKSKIFHVRIKLAQSSNRFQHTQVQFPGGQTATRKQQRRQKSALPEIKCSSLKLGT